MQPVNFIVVCVLLLGLCVVGLWFEEEFVKVDDLGMALDGARSFEAKFISLTSTSKEVRVLLKATDQYPRGMTFRCEGEYKTLIYTFE